MPPCTHASVHARLYARLHALAARAQAAAATHDGCCRGGPHLATSAGPHERQHFSRLALAADVEQHLEAARGGPSRQGGGAGAAGGGAVAAARARCRVATPHMPVTAPFLGLAPLLPLPPPSPKPGRACRMSCLLLDSFCGFNPMTSPREARRDLPAPPPPSRGTQQHTLSNWHVTCADEGGGAKRATMWRRERRHDA